MDTILCLTDYKENSDQTLRFACHFANRLHSTLIFAHFFEAAGAALEEDGSSSLIRQIGTEPAGEKHTAELQKLKGFIQQHSTEYLSPQADLRYLVAGGSPLDHLPILFQEYDPDLIVMGMRNRTGLADRLFGTLARKMIDKTLCPLLLIPPESTFREIHRMVYATDFGYKNLHAIEYLMHWSDLLEAQLHLVHVSEDPEDSAWAESQMEKIRRTYEDENEHNRMQFSILSGELQEALENFIEAARSDMIALTTHTRGYWEKWMASSLAKDLAEEVEIPLLVFKE